MKRLIKIFFIFTIFMLLIFGITVFAIKRLEVGAGVPASYDEEQLEVYKQVWEAVKTGIDINRDKILRIVTVFWGAVLLAGYILIAAIYYWELKPLVELQRYSAEIAKGNLDTVLPVKKNSLFVGFSESFDIMREELKSSKEREMEAENAKRQMVAELSHDLKTPVATIQATCEVLQLQMEKKKELAEIEGLQEKVGFISKKADTINELVQNVLHAAIDDMEEVRVYVEETDSRVIQQCFEGLSEYGNIILDNHIPGCLVYLDKLRMEQVIDNIIGNSNKYAGTDVHVSFSELDNVPSADKKTNQYIKITVRDSGPGVPEEELPLVTEKYFRGGASGDKTGYGLGLYLVKLYMERQGGGMEYYNDNGFVVELLVRKV